MVLSHENSVVVATCTCVRCGTYRLLLVNRQHQPLLLDGSLMVDVTFALALHEEPAKVLEVHDTEPWMFTVRGIRTMTALPRVSGVGLIRPIQGKISASRRLDRCRSTWEARMNTRRRRYEINAIVVVERYG